MRLMAHSAYRLGRASEGAGIISALNHDIAGAPGRSYTDKLRMLYQTNPAIVGPMAGSLSGRVMGIMINQTRSQADIDIGKAMEMAANSYFGFASSYLGYLNYDEAAWKSLRNKRLMLLDFPQSIIVRRLNEATNVLLRQCGIEFGPHAGAANGLGFRSL